MAFNVKDGSTYLDGVPVKISSKFIPPRPYAFPYAYDEKPNTDLLNEVYDFNLEKNVIQHHSKRLQQLEKAKSKSTSENASSETGSDSPSNGDLNRRESISSAHTSALSFQPDTILLPKPQQLQDKLLPVNTAQSNSFKINLSDFENDTSSPFDYMELQTINDLEELSSVFQGINNNSSQEEIPSVKDNSEILSNVSKSNSFPFPSNSKDFETGKDFGRGSLPSSSYEIPRMISSLKQVEDFPSDSNLKLYQVPYISSNAGAQARPTIARVPSLLRSSKSYSDISSLGKDEDISDKRERSHTPPSTFTYSVKPEPAPSIDVTSSNGDCDSDLPDPYHELESGAQEFVDSITEMGFLRPQVARTVKHLGTDEKKVVEHLCQIQALEESGYESLEAEAALHLHDYNRDEAKMFLDLVSQFQDLGFEKKAVKKALVQNKNDWNKTIDALLL